MMSVDRVTILSTEGLRTRAITTLVLVGIAIALLASQSFAQQPEESPTFDLVGHVYGEGGQPLVGAFVRIAGSEWGSITNDDGRFLLPDMDAGAVELEVEQLGYETLAWRGDARAGRPVELYLKAQPILLEGLHVVTDRFQTRRNGAATSVRWFDRSDLVTGAYTTALDFLSARGGLTPFNCNGRFTNRCLRVRGRVAEPVVYVDEVPVLGGMEYLESLAPYDLYMIEVFGSGRHIRAYTPQFMERAAKQRLRPLALLF